MKLLNPLPQRLDTGATATFAGLLAGDGTAAAPSISFAAQSNTGFYRRASGQTAYSSAGVISLFFDASGGIWDANGQARWKFNGTGGLEAIAGGTAQNITLSPSTTGVVAVSSANWDVSSALFSVEVKSYAAFASGRGGSIGFGGLYDGSNSATFAGIAGQKESAVSGETGGMFTFHTRGNGGPMSERARLLSNGRFLLGTTTDNGALLQVNGSASFASSISLAASVNISFASGGFINFPSDGVCLLRDNAATGFTRLQFGGTTASFPALQRSGANIQVVDAASSGYTTILALNFWATGPATTVSAGNVSYGGTTATTVGAAGGASALPATPTGYIIVNVAGTQMKVPYYAN